MATTAGIQIEARTESISHGFHLRELWHSVVGKKIEFASRQTSDRRPATGGTAAETWIDLG